MTIYYCKDCQSEYSKDEAKELASVDTDEELKAAWLSGIHCPNCGTELERRN